MTRLILPDGEPAETLLNEMAERYSLVRRTPRSASLCFYDTFDWRLFQQDLVLWREAETYFLRRIGGDRILASATSSGQTRPKFWWEFPAGPLRKNLKDFLGVRSLLHLATISKRLLPGEVVNADREPILRWTLEEVLLEERAGSREIQRAIALQATKQNRRHFNDAKKFLLARGLTDHAPDQFWEVMSAAGIRPGSYSSKVRIDLDPVLPARRATCLILRTLLRTLQQNEVGIRNDIDTEFLHDFRVAVRRTRSALTQIKGVFPPSAIDPFKKDFAQLGKLSNRLRDLDVYLLNEKEYFSLLPKDLRPGLKPMFQTFSAERELELDRLRDVLAGDFYRDLVARWSRFLDTADDETQLPAENARFPVLDLAREFIARKQCKVLNLGLKIDETAPDPHLHRLRIECKKLRYLIEFFASLFPPREVGRLVKQLKRLQDNLGSYHDLSVQLKDLGQYLSGLDPAGQGALVQAAAIGGLIACLDFRQQEVRHGFSDTFRRFAKQGNTDLYRELFDGSRD